ncbi:MAG: hypothetical protein AAGF12_31105, partial [Myxococcota bacterium]
PDGTYLCNDDAEGRHPIIASIFPPGAYQVFIGSYTQGQSLPYNLGFSELATTTVASIGTPAGAAQPSGGGNMVSNYGTVTLSPGFTPDPHRQSGSSGGQVSASTLSPNCTGWVSTNPDHIFVAEGNFGFLKVMVRARRDTTLVIQKPDGTYICNDDAENRNPVLAGAFPQGTYRVWVGSYTQGRNANYTLGFSELAQTTTRDLR